MTERRRTPSNVAGPFYVEADQCIQCRAPEAEAPALIAFDESCQSCYFARQPTDPESTHRAIAACTVSCIRALRYGGSDPQILRRLARVELTAQCDVPIAPANIEPLSIVTFADHGEHSCDVVARKLAGAIATGVPGLAVSAVTSLVDHDVLLFGYRWTPTESGIDVTVQRSDDGLHRWRATLRRTHDRVLPWSGTTFDDALRALPEFVGRRWYSETEWRGPRHWEPYPL